MKILQFITPAGFYGAERWVLALANNLDATKVVCDLAVSEEGGNQDLALLDHYPKTAGKTYRIPMNGRFDWRAVSRLVRLIQDQDIELLHTHGYKSDIIGWLAARRAGIPCVSTPHGFPGKVGMKMRLFVGLGTLMLRFFEAVAPLSKELVEDMWRFHVPQKKIHFIRNGVDLKEIDTALSELVKSHESNHDIFTIGFIGQMIPRKGVSELLMVFDRFHQNHPNTRLKLVGDGQERRELEQTARELPSHDAIEFLGFRTDRLKLLQEFDLFAMTSSLEGIPRCMMEAMASGVPVAGYTIPGVDELLRGGETGFATEFGSREGLYACFEDAMNNPEKARDRARMARQLIETTYSAARMAREYEELFSRVIRSRTAVDGRESD